MGLDTKATVTIRYMGIEHEISADPTVNVKNGQVMFHFGAVGFRRLPFGIRAVNAEGETENHELSFGVGGNVMTGLEIDKWQGISQKYGLTQGEEDLDEGETTR